jgi:hypothetical protein
MVKALTPKSEFEYVLRCDRELPEEDQTVFILRPLTVSEQAEVADVMFGGTAGSEDLIVRSGSVQIKTLRKGLVGWKNFLREDGSEVTFAVENKRKGIQLQLLDLLSMEHRVELSDAISSGSKPTVAEGN